MQNRKGRLQQIRLIVSSQKLEKQEDLQHEIEKAGFHCTQATLCRDLKQLRICKVRGRNGKSIYALPGEGVPVKASTRQEANKNKWKVQFSANLMVIHTPPGHASMVAYDIDCIGHPYLLGTVAGDDTVLVVLAEDAERESALNVVRKVVKNI